MPCLREELPKLQPFIQRCEHLDCGMGIDEYFGTQEGGIVVAPPKKDVVGYVQSHQRVYESRGKASSHKCSRTCNNQAQEWAQLKGADGQSIDDFVPMCCSCHQKYDEHWNSETKAKVSESVRRTWAENPSRRAFSEQHKANLRAAWGRRKARDQGGDA